MAQQEEIVPFEAQRLLILDANILLRAVLGTRVRTLLYRYCESVPFLLPASCLDEVRRYVPTLCAKRNWEVQPALDLLAALLSVVQIVEPGFYSSFEHEARRRIGFRDVADWPVIALSLSLEAPIWTEDSDFFGAGVATWTTETVELYLSDEPWMLHEPPAPGYGGAQLAADVA